MATPPCSTDRSAKGTAFFRTTIPSNDTPFFLTRIDLDYDGCPRQEGGGSHLDEEPSCRKIDHDATVLVIAQPHYAG